MNDPIHDIGFLGLGQMGLPMAERLIGTDVRLHVYDPSPSAMQKMVAAGAIGHSSPRSVADASTMVFACLPNPTVSLQVVSEPNGIAAGRSIKTYVEMSTIGPASIELISTLLQAHRVKTIDAPVSGGPSVARAGTLTMMVAGAPADVAIVEPWLQRIGEKVFVLGERPGQAQIMKLVNNLIMATNVVVAAEGLVMGAKAGLDPDLMMAVLNSSSGRSFASIDILARSALLSQFNFGGALSIVAKDVAAGLAEAKRLEAQVPVIERSGELWREAMMSGGADEDFTSIVKLVESRSGALMRRPPERTEPKHQNLSRP